MDCGLPLDARAAPAAQPRLRVLHVVTSLLVGGMEQFVLRLAREQQDQGHRVSILGLRGGPLRDEAIKLGLPVQTLDGGGKLSRTARTLLLLGRERPHIVHAHNPKALPYALFGKLCGARVLMTRHGQLAEWNPGRAETRWTDAVVAVSGAAAETLRERRPELTSRLSTILNGVQFSTPTRTRDEVRSELGLQDLTATIVARLDRLKGHASLLQAVAALKRRGINLTLLIAGDGSERTNLEALAADLGIAPAVRFLGFRTDVADLLAASDLFVLPSHTEGMPLSVLEAMSHRLPVVATPVGGIPEALNGEECGVSIPVADDAALTEALAELAGDANRREALGRAGERRAREHFSFSGMTRDYEALYRRLLAGQGAAG